MTLIVFLLISLIGGSGAPLIKFTLHFFPPVLLVFLRGLFAAMVMLPFIYNKLSLKEGKKYLFAANILFAANWIAFAFGIGKTSIIMAQNIYLPTSLLVAVLGYFYLKEKLSRYQIYGLILTLVGLAVFLNSSLKSQDVLSFGSPLGNLLVFSGLILWSTYTVVSRKISNIYSPQLICFFNFIVTASIALIFVPLELSRTTFNIDALPARSIFSLASVITFPSILFFFLYQWLVKNTSAFISSLVLYPVTILAGASAIIFFGEKLTPTFILGSLFIFAGVFLATSWQYAKKYIKY
ncbi:DMT family transporter [Candidatus Curtissbacteria bacterium]|nr:DMT family transporter [Candidatus Curtissbacteria bacterium]